MLGNFSHPANENILRYLKNPYEFMVGEKAPLFRQARECDLAGARVKESQSPESINWLNLGTHPDIVDRFWKELGVLLPEPCRWVIYGHPALVHPESGVIFGFAGGSCDYALRLPEELRMRALKAGATTKRTYNTPAMTLDFSIVDVEWVFLKWLKEEERWCLEAYRHACR